MTFVYFTDRDLGNRFPDILRSAGLAVEQHRDHFVHDAPDDEWLAAVGARGWIALTHNRRIRYQPNELEAVMRHRVALLGDHRRGALSGARPLLCRDIAAHRALPRPQPATFHR